MHIQTAAGKEHVPRLARGEEGVVARGPSGREPRAGEPKVVLHDEARPRRLVVDAGGLVQGDAPLERAAVREVDGNLAERERLEGAVAELGAVGLRHVLLALDGHAREQLGVRQAHGVDRSLRPTAPVRAGDDDGDEVGWERATKGA